MTRPEHVTSIRGIRYLLGRELGRGGQGAVFAVDGARLAVKLLFGRSPQLRERLRDQLAMVARLPLEGLAIARPVDQLRPPHVGYVMELFTGMVPLRSLLQPPKGDASVTRWYLDGGGLGRRLRLLAHVAEAISALHGRGLIYTDLSPHNVFVSANTDNQEVRLIDIDNLHAATTTGCSVYTPRYGAPEVVRQKTSSPSTLADAYAFAVLAFETLAVAHPLLGDEVQDGEPTLEEKALAGELPWIDSPDDDSNRSTSGIPREVVLSPRLQQDFQIAFGSGLSNPEARPGMATWAEHLHRAADRTIVCPSCSGSYYVNRDACPWCATKRPDCVVARAMLWDPEWRGNMEDDGIPVPSNMVVTPAGTERVLDQVVISEGRPSQLSERVTHGSGGASTLTLTFAQRRITVAPHGQGCVRLVPSNRESSRLVREPVDLPIGNDQALWRIHFGDNDQLHRVIRLDMHRGAT